MPPRSAGPPDRPAGSRQRCCPRPFWVVGGLFLLAQVVIVANYATWQTSAPEQRFGNPALAAADGVIADALDAVREDDERRHQVSPEDPAPEPAALEPEAAGQKREEELGRIRHASLGECGGSRPRGLLQPDCRWAWDDVPSPRLIVEFGGNQGDDLQHFLDLHAEAVVHSFEPVKKYYEMLRQNFGENKRVRLYHLGASGSDAKVRFRTDGDSAASSEFGTARGAEEPVYEEVQLRDASAVLKEVVAKEGRGIDVLSINCEGCEYAILERLLATGWLQRVRYLQVSWHTSSQIPKRKPRRCRLLRELRAIFRPSYQADFAWEGYSSLERRYAAETRYLPPGPLVAVGRGNSIGQAQGGIQCGPDPNAEPPRGASRLAVSEDPEAAHLTYPQTIEGDVVTAFLLATVLQLPATEGPSPLIVEVGAGDGAGVRFRHVLAKNPSARVHSFEPVKSLREALEADPTAFNLTTGGRKVWPYGWADEDRRAQFRTWGTGPPESKKQRWEGHLEEGELWDAGKAMKQLVDAEQREPSLLYLNCEGCEYEVLQRLLDTGWLPSLKRLAVSWHAGGAPWQRRCALDAVLRRSHRRETAAESFELWIATPPQA